MNENVTKTNEITMKGANTMSENKTKTTTAPNDYVGSRRLEGKDWTNNKELKNVIESFIIGAFTNENSNIDIKKTAIELLSIIVPKN